MSNEYAVQIKGVSKVYSLKSKDHSKHKKQFYALKDISFEVKKGDVVGILGTNGSGKSTLSSILSEITCPDKGTVKINGEQALIAINTGLNNQLTGFENIQFKGALLGLSKSRIQEITKGVIEFAELGDFLYQPVKNYSSGMKSRLGFSISICLDPDILIIDEALSVGDKAFADKCIKKFEEFKIQGKTIFFISHSLSQVQSFCTKGLWIEGGKLKEYGPIDEVATEYAKHVENFKRLSNIEKKEYSEKVFQSRVVKMKPKSLKRRVKSIIKKRNKLLYAKLMASLTLITGLIGSGIYSFGMLLNQDNNSDISSTVTMIQDPFKFLVMIEGMDIKEYQDSYRDYLNEYQGKAILDMLSVEINQDGEISITRIPANLQYYYDEFNVYDEIRFINLVENPESVQTSLSEMMSFEWGQSYIITQENLLKSMTNLGIHLEVNGSQIIYEIDGEKILIDYHLYNEETNDLYSQIIKKVANKIKSLEKSDQKNFINQLFINTLGKKEVDILNLLNIGDLSNVFMKTLNVKSRLIQEFIDEEDQYKIVDKSPLEKELIFLNEGSLNENIYLVKLENEIELYIDPEEPDIEEIEEENDETDQYNFDSDNSYIDGSLNESSSGDNSSSSGSNSGGSSNGSNSGGSSNGSNSGGSSNGSNSGGSSNGSNSGDSLNGSNSGGSSNGSNSGGSSNGSNSGDSSNGSNSGDSLNGSNSGDSSNGSNSGDSSNGSNSGDSSSENALGETGDTDQLE